MWPWNVEWHKKNIYIGYSALKQHLRVRQDQERKPDYDGKCKDKENSWHKGNETKSFLDL